MSLRVLEGMESAFPSSPHPAWELLARKPRLLMTEEGRGLVFGALRVGWNRPQKQAETAMRRTCLAQIGAQNERDDKPSMFLGVPHQDYGHEDVRLWLPGHR